MKNTFVSSERYNQSMKKYYIFLGVSKSEKE